MNPNSRVYIFDQVGSNTFILHSGLYRFELWGAAGGGGIYGGKGAYAKGVLRLPFRKEFQYNIGGQGKTPPNKTKECIEGGFNGGGKGGASYNANYSSGSSGGGATDIRTSSDIDSRIIVAAGGGGSSGVPKDMGIPNIYPLRGGSGGNETGEAGEVHDEYKNAVGVANQTAGFEKGNGQDGRNSTILDDNGAEGSGGAGGGYWGGYALQDSGVSSNSGGGGGSSYVNTTFYDTELIAGNQLMPLPSGENGIGNSNDGYIRITLLSPITTQTPTKQFQFFILHFGILSLNK